MIFLSQTAPPSQYQGDLRDLCVAGCHAGCLAIMLFAPVGLALGPYFGPALLERFLVRSMDTAGAFARYESLLWYVYGHFVDAMGLLTIAVAALALLLLCVRPGTIPGPLKDYFFLLLVPSVLLVLIFRQHAAVHQFIIVKFMLPVSILLGGILPPSTALSA